MFIFQTSLQLCFCTWNYLHMPRSERVPASSRPAHRLCSRLLIQLGNELWGGCVWTARLILKHSLLHGLAIPLVKWHLINLKHFKDMWIYFP